MACRRKETIVKKTRNATLWAAFGIAALLVGTGCQSTGHASKATTQMLPAEVDSEVASTEEAPAAVKSDLQTVYFDYDRWELRGDARKALQGNAQQLKASPERSVVTVSGHCDERGSEEYNLALGDRRASAVKRYLVDMGVAATRVRTMSFGEGRPVTSGEGEAAWSRNRRAEFSLGSEQASR
jgi:peptidoglycan-associated lipoprotein